MAEKLFTNTIRGFTEYIKIAYEKVLECLTQYNIPPDKLDVISPLFNTYVQAEQVAANPETATSGARHTRDEARKLLEPAWRTFLNEYIRYNTAVSIADKEIFGIKPRDTVRTPTGVPDNAPTITIRNTGRGSLEAEVLNSITGKKKKPLYATGSYVYKAVTEVGQVPPHTDDYHKQDFSSNCHHVLTFPFEELGKQLNIYATYSNAHGKEGPRGSVETTIIS